MRRLGFSFGISRRARVAVAGGGGVPANALTLNGQVLQLNGQTLTYGA